MEYHQRSFVDRFVKQVCQSGSLLDERYRAKNSASADESALELQSTRHISRNAMRRILHKASVWRLIAPNKSENSILVIIRSVFASLKGLEIDWLPMVIFYRNIIFSDDAEFHIRI